jgi:hypothetical protein
MGETQPMPEVAPQPVVSQVMPLDEYELPAGGAAIAALFFAIVGVVGPLPFIGSLLALGFARRARREAQWRRAGGRELARAARIIAWTGIIVAIVVAAAIAGLIVWNHQRGHGYTLRIR